MHVVREEHWAANGSHAYMVNVSAGQFKILKISGLAAHLYGLERLICLIV